MVADFDLNVGTMRVELVVVAAAGCAVICYLQLLNVVDLTDHLKEDGVAVKWILLFLHQKDFVVCLVGRAFAIAVCINAVAAAKVTDEVDVNFAVVVAEAAEFAVPVRVVAVAAVNAAVGDAAVISVDVAVQVIVDCFEALQVGLEILKLAVLGIQVSFVPVLERTERNYVFVANSVVAGKQVFARYLGRKVVGEVETVEGAVPVEDGDVDCEELGAVEDVVETDMVAAGIVVDVEIAAFASVVDAAVAVAVVVVEIEVNA
jgi:hypothetical protein